MARILLTVGLLLVCVLAAAGLWHGWRSRAARQGFLPALPPAPTDIGPAVVAPLTGLYAATTLGNRWQERIVAQGLGRRAAGSLRGYAAGLVIDRDDDTPIFLPAAVLRSVRTAPGIAGKVMGRVDGVVIVGWELDGYGLDSGFRADDRDEQAGWIAAVRAAYSLPAPAA